jgi:hypothetical protein
VAEVSARERETRVQALIGTRDEMVQALLERRQRFGLSYFTVFERPSTPSHPSSLDSRVDKSFASLLS